jgi:GLPGLI family protein
MKYLIFLSFFLLIFYDVLFEEETLGAETFNINNIEQYGIVTYKIGSTISEEEIEEKIKTLEGEQQEYGEVLRNIERQTRDLEYELKFNATKSLFRHKKLLAEEEHKVERKLALITISSNAIYFKDFKKQRQIKQEEYSGQLVNVKERFNTYDWTILNETKKIGKYECKKASTIVMDMTMDGEKEREIIAWFTEEIPVPFGPRGIDGLPGLIMEVSYKGSYYFYASEVILGSDIIKEKDLTLPKGGNEISEEEWDEFHRKENERIRKKSK